MSLEQVKGEIEAEYEQSLAVLLPIKRQLAATDALIDQVVYKLYGLTDEEIAIVERPAYEQALGDAKSEVLKDKALAKDPRPRPTPSPRSCCRRLSAYKPRSPWPPSANASTRTCPAGTSSPTRSPPSC